LTEVFRKVQQKLNRLSLHTLGMILAKCDKADILYKQALLAMSPEFDRERLNDEDSLRAVNKLANNKWEYEHD